MSAPPAERVGDWSDITAALRANLLPGLILWALAVVAVAAFYFLPAAHPLFAHIAATKAAWGYGFSFLVAGVFGGLVPCCAVWLLGRPLPLRHAILLIVMCAWRGLEVDAFYRLQGMVWGSQATLATVAAKVACDQLGYSVFWSSPTTIALFAWRDGGFTGDAWRSAWRPASIITRLRSVVLCNWLVWTPTVCLVYSLPADLQIPLFSLATTFWSLTLLLLISRRPT